MKVKAIAMTLALGFAGAAVCLAADGFIGTWKLNELKSKLSPGTPKNTTVVYATMGDNIMVTIDGTDAAGKRTHTEWMGKYDGKDYAVTGDSTSDSRSVTKIDDHTLTFTVKKGDKVLFTGRIVLSADGKTRTVTTEGTDSSGKTISATAVYDKQ
jgi:hypothetical protein